MVPAPWRATGIMLRVGTDPARTECDEASSDGEPSTAGTYTTDGDEITFDDSYCEYTRVESNPVTYTFEWDGEVLAPAARGQLDLDAPVSTYVDRPFDTHGATVRQLVAMRSGFPTTDVGNDQTRMAADLGRTWTTREWLAAIPTDARGSARWAASPATTASTTARAELRSDQAARRLSLIRNRPPPTAPSPSNSEVHGASPPVAGS